MKKAKKNTNKPFIGLLIQVILLAILIIVAVMSLYIKEFGFLAEITIGLLLIVTGINNHYVYKRKGFTIVYILGGIVMIAFALYGLVVNGF